MNCIIQKNNFIQTHPYLVCDLDLLPELKNVIMVYYTKITVYKRACEALRLSLFRFLKFEFYQNHNWITNENSIEVSIEAIMADFAKYKENLTLYIERYCEGSIYRNNLNLDEIWSDVFCSMRGKKWYQIKAEIYEELEESDDYSTII